MIEIPFNDVILVNIRDLDLKPGPYCMSYGFTLDPLIRSLNLYGLLNRPIVVSKRGGRLDVVTGYKRILALDASGIYTQECIDVTAIGLKPLDLLLLNLYDNLCKRDFNDVEKSMILKRLSSYLSRNEILDIYMPMLHLPSNPDYLNTYLEIEAQDNKVKKSVVDGHITIRALQVMLGLDVRSRKELAHWLMKLKFNSNNQMQFIEFTIDIAHNESMEVFEVLNSNIYLNILADNQLNDPQKIKKLLRKLRERRFPRLVHYEKRFRERRNNLKLPNGVTLNHPPYFESSQYRIDISFENGLELKKKLDQIRSSDQLETIGQEFAASP